MQVINLTGYENWSNVYTLSGYLSRQSLVLTNNTPSVIFVAQQTLAPATLSTLAKTLSVAPNDSVLIQGNSIPVWVSGPSGPVIVQDATNLITPFDGIDPRVYVGTQAFTTQSFTEANCKNGVQYELTTFNATFAAGAVTDFILTTGSKPVLIKNRQFTFTGSQLNTTIYKNPTYTGGTVVPYYNLSDINPVAGTVVIRGTPTVTSPGTQIAPTFTLLGSIPQTGQAVTTTSAENSLRGLERVLAPNTTYLFRTINTSAATMLITTQATWYEGGLSSTAF